MWFIVRDPRRLPTVVVPHASCTLPGWRAVTLACAENAWFLLGLSFQKGVRALGDEDPLKTHWMGTNITP